MATRRDLLRLLGAGGLSALADLLPRAAAAEPAAAAHTAEPGLLAYTESPQNLATPLHRLDRLIVPTDVFFVRSHFGPPRLRRDRRLQVTGRVQRPLELGVAELQRYPEVTLTAVLQCAGNGRALVRPRVPGVQWEHGAMGQATWTGVRLADVLAAAGIASGAAHVRLLGADRPPKPSVPAFARSIPLERALDPSTLIASRMNGEPLTLAHGAPLRLVVPGWAGDHWVKWLTGLQVHADEAPGFYMKTAYRLPLAPVPPGTSVPPEKTRPVTTFPIKSVIARPAEGERAARGVQEVVGVAFSGEAPIARVEIDVDGRGFRPVPLEGEAGVGRWQVFRARFDAEPGSHRARVRAIDAAGVVQPEEAVWNPSGYFWNGWHGVGWEVL